MSLNQRFKVLCVCFMGLIYRFIPDGMVFEDEPKDQATDVDLSVYKPKLFTSTATTTAKVR